MHRLARPALTAAIASLTFAAVPLAYAAPTATPTPTRSAGTPTSTRPATRPTVPATSSTAKPGGGAPATARPSGTPSATPSGTPSATPSGTPSATPSATPTHVRQHIASVLTPPTSATAPAVVRVTGPAGMAIGVLASDQGTGNGGSEAAGTIGADGQTVIFLPPPAGGWVAGHSYYYQVYASSPDVWANANRGAFTPRFGGPATSSPSPDARRAVSVQQPSCSKARRSGGVTGATPGAVVEVRLLEDGSSEASDTGAVADSAGHASFELAAPPTGWRPGVTYRLLDRATGKSDAFTFSGGECSGETWDGVTLHVTAPQCTGEPAKASVASEARAEFVWSPKGTSEATRHTQDGHPGEVSDTFLPAGGWRAGARYVVGVSSPTGSWSREFVAPTRPCATGPQKSAPDAQPGASAGGTEPAAKSAAGGLARTGR